MRVFKEGFAEHFNHPQASPPAPAAVEGSAALDMPADTLGVPMLDGGEDLPVRPEYPQSAVIDCLALALPNFDRHQQRLVRIAGGCSACWPDGLRSAQEPMADGVGYGRQ